MKLNNSLNIHVINVYLISFTFRIAYNIKFTLIILNIIIN